MIPEIKTETSLPSIILDPFLKDKIKSVWIHGRTKLDRSFAWYAWIEFENANTQGKQTTKEYEDFNNVLAELKAIFETLKQK